MKKKLPSLRKVEGEVLRLIEQNREARKEKEMKAQLKKLALKVFNPETKGGRIARTALQAFIGLLSGFGALLTVPELQYWFAELPLVVQLGGLSVVISAISAIQNYAKDVWKWVTEE